MPKSVIGTQSNMVVILGLPIQYLAWMGHLLTQCEPNQVTSLALSVEKQYGTLLFQKVGKSYCLGRISFYQGDVEKAGFGLSA